MTPIHRLRLAVIVLLVFAVACGGDPPDATESGTPTKPTRKTLEIVYTAATGAMSAGTLDGMKLAVSSRMLRQMENAMLSLKRDFEPGKMTHHPKLADWEFVELKVQKRTAGMSFRKAGKQGAMPMMEFFYVRFVHEDGSWMLDRAASSSKFKQDGQPWPPTMSWPASCAIDGVVAPTPDKVAKPDHVGMLDIMAMGLKVTGVTVNGNPQSSTVDTSSSGIIIGGLKKGQNTVALIVEAIPGKQAMMASIGVRLRPDGKGAKMKEVFKTKLEETGSLSYRFTVE